MSKSPLPTKGKRPPIAPPPGSYEAACFHNLFSLLLDMAENNPLEVLKRVRKAVLGKSIEDAVFVQGIVSDLYLRLAQSLELIEAACDYYEQLAEGKEVQPC